MKNHKRNEKEGILLLSNIFPEKQWKFNKRQKIKEVFSILLFMFSVTITRAQNNLPFHLEQQWEATGFSNPESVAIDQKNKVLYISNVSGGATQKNGKGYISKLDFNGSLIEKIFIKGLNAPKGLVVHKNKLYATDIDEIIAINLDTKQIKKYKVNGATFLNDITVDKKGNVYASNTFGFSGIYKLSKDGEVKLWMKGPQVNNPSGVFADGKYLYVASWGANPDPKTFATQVPGKLMKISLKNKLVTDITQGIGNLDGIAETLHGFLLTDWLSGRLIYFFNKEKQTFEVLDLHKGSADIAFDKNTKTVYIPLMLEGKVLSYKIKK